MLVVYVIEILIVVKLDALESGNICCASYRVEVGSVEVRNLKIARDNI